MINLLRTFSRLDTSRIWEHLNEVGAKLNEVIGRVNQVPVGAVVQKWPADWTIGPNGTIPGSEITIPNMKPEDRWALDAFLDVTPNNLVAFSVYVNGAGRGQGQLIGEGSQRMSLFRRWYLTGYTGTINVTLVASPQTGTGGYLNGGQSTISAERIL